MNYNERAIQTGLANDPAYLPSDVLAAMNDQNPFCGEPVTNFVQGDRVWYRPASGAGCYATVLAGILGRPMFVITPENGNDCFPAHRATLTLLERAR